MLTHDFTSIIEELKWNQKKNLDPFNTVIVEYYRKWHKQGRESKHKGFERINPYYGRYSKIKEYFFYCGYDGVKFEDALSTMQDKMQELQRQEIETCCVMAGVNGIHNTHCVHFTLEPTGNGTQNESAESTISEEVIIPGIGEKL